MFKDFFKKADNKKVKRFYKIPVNSIKPKN
jgi:hypothetical protein